MLYGIQHGWWVFWVPMGRHNPFRIAPTYVRYVPYVGTNYYELVWDQRVGVKNSHTHRALSTYLVPGKQGQGKRCWGWCCCCGYSHHGRLRLYRRGRQGVPQSQQQGRVHVRGARREAEPDQHRREQQQILHSPGGSSKQGCELSW